MAGKYFYNGIDVNNLIIPGDTNPDGAGSYNGFPKCTYTTLNSNFESVSISETVINSVNEYQDFNTVGTITVTPTTGYNYISAFCYGGGGGGGGGGGAGDDGAAILNKGGDGRNGGDGGYAAVEKVPINGTITLTIGGGGSSGGRGRNGDPSKGLLTWFNGEDGDNGGVGGTTTLKIGDTTILKATGGNGGNGGNGGISDVFSNRADGNNGNAGSIGTSNSASGGTAMYTSENTKLLPYSNNWGNSGGGGNGGNVKSDYNANGANAGGPGNSGGCRIYFLSDINAKSFGKYDAAIKQVAGGFISNYTYTSQSETLSIGNAFGGNINRIQAKYIDYNYSVTPITVIPPFSPCNHISVVCYGGGGGGGGGGGYANTSGFGTKNRGGDGQNGKAGGFVASEKVLLPVVNGTITLNIGAGGNLGAGGASTDTTFKDGKSGDPGGPGGTTTLQIGATILLTANGGGAGDNGGGGSQTAKGSNGDPNWKSPGNGATNATEAFKNYTAEDTANIPSHPTWGNPGDGGGGSTGGGKNGSAGSVGQPGGCRIYFLCI